MLENLYKNRYSIEMLIRVTELEKLLMGITDLAVSRWYYKLIKGKQHIPDKAVSIQTEQYQNLDNLIWRET